ncbi:helix-turn-helix domain-containing protein [Rhodococcus pyridinivorans]|nr:helix-turn-helix domain-containing protein [Rhodococcus pyridinivorans]UPK64445.1 helix-turn-helix domain-containing protein [Rhodococcus pyridinivorans]
MAGELLNAGLPVERVAHRLGYADASSFSVAFQRWTGRTPGGRGWERRSV